MLYHKYFLLQIYGVKGINPTIEEKLFEKEVLSTKSLPNENELLEILESRYNLSSYDKIEYTLKEIQEREINKGNINFKNKKIKIKE